MWQTVRRTVQPIQRPDRLHPDGLPPSHAPRSPSAPLRTPAAAISADDRIRLAKVGVGARAAGPAKGHSGGGARILKQALGSAPPDLEAKMHRRLRRGTLTINRTIDLHGMRQTQARAALETFLKQAWARGDRTVLVITGKGLSGGESGVLRQAVPRWLEHPPFRELVSGLSPAGPRHGGGGAYYVRLRKRRGVA